MWNFSKKALTVIAVLASMSQICSCGAGVALEHNTENKIQIGLHNESEKETETEAETEKKTSEFVYLDTIEPDEKSSSFHNDKKSAKDVLGQTYYNVSIIGKSKSDKQEDYARYHLGGKYKKLSGIITVHNNNSEECFGQLSILCDNKSVYATGKVEKYTAPMEFSVDVSDCEWLKICHDKSIMKFILADWKLEE
ncbi:MAG: NPCBM/NEW2 domain-containing protein [Ruminococcus sp.]|nr:NPCBM/NEW2 domain-containing protein [Ruminococcus sp.]